MQHIQRLLPWLWTMGGIWNSSAFFPRCFVCSLALPLAADHTQPKQTFIQEPLTTPAPNFAHTCLSSSQTHPRSLELPTATDH